MANIIKHKRSDVLTNEPGSLSAGELAINTADETLFTQNSSGLVVPLNNVLPSVIDCGEILPDVYRQSYGRWIHGNNDSFEALAGPIDKFYWFDNYGINAGAVFTLAIRYLVVNGIKFVVNGISPSVIVADMTATPGTALFDVTPGGVTVDFNDPPYYGALAPQTVTTVMNYIDFLNATFDALSVFALPGLANWSANNLNVFYNLPSAVEFDLVLRETIDVSGPVSVTDYRLKTFDQAGTTIKMLKDSINDMPWINWFEVL